MATGRPQKPLRAALRMTATMKKEEGVEKKNYGYSQQADDMSTCGSDGDQDTRGEEAANVAAEEDDPDEYADCLAWGFLDQADQVLNF